MSQQVLSHRSAVYVPSGMELRSDVELLLGTSHEPEQFGLFYRRHGERVLRFFATRVRSPEAAADLMAETFASAFASAHRYRQGSEPPVAWLFAIARNLLIDAHRRGEVRAKARKRLALEPLVLYDEDLRRIEELAGLPSVECLLEGLSPDERAAVRARVVDERPYEDIAGELRCSTAVVRQRVSRGLTRLRNSVEVDT
jgi:RNA polymerase sigma factor (sigma-70 family)